MEEQLIKFETAKLAIEKRFAESSKHLYFKTGQLSEIPNKNNINIKMSYSAPTQSLLQRWLREKHNIHIQIGMHEFNKWCFGLQKIDKPNSNYPRIAQNNIWDLSDYLSYEQALENGLTEALNLI